MNYEDKPLTINEALHRLEMEAQGVVAFIDFKLSGDHLFLIHTEVPAELEGKGAGTAIVQKALHYAKDHHYKIIPLCKFVQRYLSKHPEWNDIVATDSDRFLHKDEN